MSNKHLFQYHLADAWYSPISSVRVLNRQTDNVVCSFPLTATNRSRRKKDGSSEQVVTLSREALEQIKAILRQNKDIFDVSAVEVPLVIDGYINTFYFSVDGHEVRLQADNIFVYRERSSVYAQKVLDLFDQIGAVLLAAGVEEKYLQLDLDSFDDPSQP